MNNVNLVGRLTKDPELRYTPSGVATARFTIAVNRPFSNQQGEREADFIQCVAWRKQAENLSNFMKKGSLIGLTGRIQTGSYEGEDGKRIYTTDIVADNIEFLDSKGSGNAGGNAGGNSIPPAPQSTNNAPQTKTNTDKDPFVGGGMPIEVSEDDLPF